MSCSQAVLPTSPLLTLPSPFPELVEGGHDAHHGMLLLYSENRDAAERAGALSKKDKRC